MHIAKRGNVQHHNISTAHCTLSHWEK